MPLWVSAEAFFFYAFFVNISRKSNANTQSMH